MAFNKSCKINSIRVTTKVLRTCKNTPIDLCAITSGVLSDIPILLAAPIVELQTRHLVTLPEKASDINAINNIVIVTSCNFFESTNVLFIRGFIRKKIYYSTNEFSAAPKPLENLRYYRVDIPFHCTTNIVLSKSKSISIINNVPSKLEHCVENKILSKELSDSNQTTTEFFSKKPFCELVSCKIIEQCKYIYENTNICHLKPLDIKDIIGLDSNMNIKLKIQILQNQQVYIKPYYTDKNAPSLYNRKNSSNNKSFLEYNKKSKDKLAFNNESSNEHKQVLDNSYNSRYRIPRIYRILFKL